MLANLLELYPGSFITESAPLPGDESVHIFHDEGTGEWISIPAGVISEKELALLVTLFGSAELLPEKLPLLKRQWRDFLLAKGEMPMAREDEIVRLIQLQFYGNNLEREELEAAIEGFFPGEILILWEGHAGAIVVERGGFSLEERDLASMAGAFETDFYLKTAIYVGKQLPLSSDLPAHFHEERTYFNFAKKELGSGDYYTFEKVFPSYLAARLPGPLASALNREFAEAFRSDVEMFSTVKGFLENGSNASLAAKKLYIHRNTLQYRIDKFTDRTGVNLKDFHSAFTVYLACLLHNNEEKQE